MTRIRKKLFSKVLLMTALTGAIIGVSRAGYDVDEDRHSDPRLQENNDTAAVHARALVQTLSEEKTEIAALAAQQAKFREMGDAESHAIARLYGRWIREHKAGGPMLVKLIEMHGGDPDEAKILKAPVLGDKHEMLMATHKDHEAAVMTSQMRYMVAKNDGDAMVMKAMHKRANMARKHIRQMKPYHDM